MASDGSDDAGLDRRTLLRRVGAGSALALGGIQGTGAAAGGRLDADPIPAGTYEPDTSHLPAVASARVVIHEGGSVSKHLGVDGTALAERRAAAAGASGRQSETAGDGQTAGGGPTVSTYSIGLELESYDRDRARALSEGRPEEAGLHAVVGRRDRPVAAGRPESRPGEGNGRGGNGTGTSTAAKNGVVPEGAQSDGATAARSGPPAATNARQTVAGAGPAQPDVGATSRGVSTSASTAAPSSTSAAASSSAGTAASSSEARTAAVSILSHEDGIDEQPATGGREYAAFGQTESQECGPLARTTVRSDAYTSSYGTWFYDTTAERESVDGDACAGHEWNATFEAFCDFFGYLPGYDCAIPSAFDTDWNVYAADRRGTRSGTVFTCGNFPAIPDTVVSAHDVTMTEGSDGVGVEFDSVVGVAPYNDVSDYDFDVNGISNLIVDGLATLFPGVDSVYSYALATYLLKHNGAVVA